MKDVIFYIIIIIGVVVVVVKVIVVVVVGQDAGIESSGRLLRSSMSTRNWRLWPVLYGTG